jgi:hypothetical protein
MSGVDGFVAEDAVDGEVAAWAGVGCQTVEDVGGNGGCVGAQDQFSGFRVGVGVAVADGAESTVLVYFFDVVVVLLVIDCGGRGGCQTGIVEFRVLFHGFEGRVCDGVGAGRVGAYGVRDVEGVLEVAGGVLLGHEEGVEVPESSVDESVRTTSVIEVGGRDRSQELTCQ